MENQAGQRRERNTGLDLLRIVCMIMIPLMHVLGNGGITPSRAPLSASWAVCQGMEIFCLCAVNCFGMISGYACYGRRLRYASLMTRWAQALFYTLPTTALFLIFRRDLVSGNDILRAFLPFSYSSAYWYFSAYFVLFFFMPYLNWMVEKMDQKRLNSLLAACFLVFSLLATAIHADLGHLSYGFSTLWLGVMYLFGAYFAKYGTEMRWNNRINLLIYLLSAAGAAALVMGIRYGAHLILHREVWAWRLLNYVSPFIVICGLALFLFFANLKCGKRLTGFVRIFAPVTFGVYLFQEEPLLRATLLVDRLKDLPDWPPLVVAAAALGIAAAIWLVGSGIDWVRIQLFRLLKLKQRFELLEDWLRNLAARLPWLGNH